MMKNEQLFDEVKYRKERNGKILFYVIAFLIVGIVLLNIANYIISNF